MLCWILEDGVRKGFDFKKKISKLAKFDSPTDFDFDIGEGIGGIIIAVVMWLFFSAALIALFLVMVYITLRFEYRFSIGAIIALIHDIIILMGIFSLFQVEFNLSVFAAILAVIGYSLNDTIVVFDRIRENFQETINNDQSDIKEIINHSINQTLSRTVITSFTTLLVLFSLITLGGESLFGFSFALILGVIIGTYSSIYIASSYLIVSKISAKDMQIEKNDKDDNDGAVV